MNGESRETHGTHSLGGGATERDSWEMMCPREAAYWEGSFGSVVLSCFWRSSSL